MYVYVTNSPQFLVDPTGEKGLKAIVQWYFGVGPKKRSGGGKKQTYAPYTGKYTKATGFSKSPVAWDEYHRSKGYSVSRQDPLIHNPPKFAGWREKAAYNLGYGGGSAARWWSSD